MGKRIGAEARIIALFTALPDESKRIVFDVIKSQQVSVRRPKQQSSSAPSAQKRSKPKSDSTVSTPSIADSTANALSATGD